MARLLAVAALPLGLILASCDTTWSTAGAIRMGELDARCIEGDVASDDVFIFEARTSGLVAAVEVDVRRGGAMLGTVELFEQEPSAWSRETRASNLGSTCAEFGELHLFFRATGDDETVLEVEY